MNKLDKDLHRKLLMNINIGLVVFLAVSSVVLTFLGKLMPEFNLALGAILAYAGSHTYQNMKTSPTQDPAQEKGE